MDDRTRSTDPTGERWDHDRFITFASITGAQLNGEMSEDDYARFGRFVFGSLSALAKFRLPEES